ncbi:MAG: tRNA (adenosine(37)-N6)-dimethylallyltransferase MiaA [Clostridia bacterium]|nr:tRNA (adenosine(37)-N6)-dimethylallyltransferase MiaA [Clostridia bacterium]
MAEYKIPLIAVVGPTASGKTSLGVNICKRIGGQVVSCDSMQIYKGMDIATAKPTADEMQGVPHHLIDFASPAELFSVAAYCEKAKKCIDEIRLAGDIPVLVGGTGLYYSSLVDNIGFIEQETDYEYRQYLRDRAEKEGAAVLLAQLKEIDPEAASKLHENNLGRVIRALEIYHSTGKTKSEQNELSRSVPSPYKLTAICLDARDRQVLYDRINMRVDIMLENGLLEEAKRFFESDPSGTAVQAIGYKELKPYLDGEKSLDECVENLKMQTRRYAKRQLTWFRRDERMHFLYIDDYSSAEELTDAAMEIIGKESADEKG